MDSTYRTNLLVFFVYNRRAWNRGLLHRDLYQTVKTYTMK